MSYDPEHDPEWESLSRKVFPEKNPKAPAFLWTRILAAIEIQESERAVWWRQWRWMSRLATAMTLLVSLAAGAVLYEDLQGVPLDSLLKGTNASSQNTVVAEASAPPEIVTAWLVEGGSSWEEN